MKTFYKIASWLLAILGGIHLSMTHVFYGKLSVSALWFAGTGLSLVFLGLLNYAALKAAVRSIFSWCIFANILAAIYFVFIVFALPEPQSCIGVVLILGVLIGSITFRIQSNHEK